MFFLNIISSGLEIYFFPWESVCLESSAFGAKITIKLTKILKKSRSRSVLVQAVFLYNEKPCISCANPPPRLRGIGLIALISKLVDNPLIELSSYPGKVNITLCMERRHSLLCNTCTVHIVLSTPQFKFNLHSKYERKEWRVFLLFRDSCTKFGKKTFFQLC